MKIITKLKLINLVDQIGNILIYFNFSFICYQYYTYKQAYENQEKRLKKMLTNKFKVFTKNDFKEIKEKSRKNLSINYLNNF
jgi:hypothetical protein